MTDLRIHTPPSARLQCSADVLGNPLHNKVRHLYYVLHSTHRILPSVAARPPTSQRQTIPSSATPTRPNH